MIHQPVAPGAPDADDAANSGKGENVAKNSPAQSAKSEAERRRSRRVALSHVRFYVHDFMLEFEAMDLSFQGLGFEYKNWPVIPYAQLTVDIIFNGKPMVRDLKARVVRLGGGVAGCEFEEMNQEQKDAVQVVVMMTL